MTVEKTKKQSTKRYAIKRKFKFENYKNCLEATQLENKINIIIIYFISSLKDTKIQYNI